MAKRIPAPAVFFLLSVNCFAQSKDSLSPQELHALIVQLAHQQIATEAETTPALTYLSRKVDQKEDVVRRVVESANGTVARTLERNGKPLDADAQQAELARLRSITPESLQRRRKNEQGDKYARELVNAMPDAMTYTPAAGQPQIAGYNSPVLVLDFSPNPAFKPKTTAEGLLSGLDGRAWIDSRTHRLVQLHVNIRHDLNYALGLVAKIYSGGTIDVEFRNFQGRTIYTRVALDVTVRELLIRTQHVRQTVTTSDYRALPGIPSTADAVRMLTEATAANLAGSVTSSVTSSAPSPTAR